MILRILVALACLLSATQAAGQPRLATINTGAEYYTIATRPITTTCADDLGCATVTVDTWLESLTVQWTNYLAEQVALFVIIASADGTPWSSDALRLHSAVVMGQPLAAAAYTVPGPYFLPVGWKVFTAIDVFREPWDTRTPHVEHQTTLRIRSAASDGL